MGFFVQIITIQDLPVVTALLFQTLSACRHSEQTGCNVHNVHPWRIVFILFMTGPRLRTTGQLCSGTIPPSRRPDNIKTFSRDTDTLKQTRMEWIGRNITVMLCCHYSWSHQLDFILRVLSSRWRWYRCSEMCYSRNLVGGEKNISRSHPHQFISGKFPFPVTSPRSRTPPKKRLQKRFVWIIMCLVWRNNGDWCLHLSSYFSCLGPRALQRCTSNQAIREGSRGTGRASYQMFVLNIFTSTSTLRKSSSYDYM